MMKLKGKCCGSSRLSASMPVMHKPIGKRLNLNPKPALKLRK